MFKKFIVVILCIGICSSLFAAPGTVLSTAECKVTLNTKDIEYFECGFTADENPQSPIEQVSTYAIGTGGITPAKNIELKATRVGSDLKIESSIYTIWAFKIGVKTINITLKASTLSLDGINIPYNVYIDNSNPAGALSPAISVVNSQQEYTIPTEGMNSFVKFWTTKFMMKVPKIPPNVTSGTYNGTLTLTITSI